MECLPWGGSFSPCDGCPFEGICSEANGCLRDFNDPLYWEQDEEQEDDGN